MSLSGVSGCESGRVALVMLFGLTVSCGGPASPTVPSDPGPDPDPPPPLVISLTIPPNCCRYFDDSDVFLHSTVTPPRTADSVVWRSSRDGRLASGETLVVTGLSLGAHVISATAYDAAEKDSAVVGIHVETLPDVTITQPASGSVFSSLDGVQFAGNALDRDGGISTLVWRSNLEGTLGIGEDLQTPYLGVGRHTIWLVATDDEVTSDSVSIVVTVEDRSTADFALRFDSAQTASTPHHEDFYLPFIWTIEVWMKPFDALRDGEQRLVSKDGAFELGFSDQTLYVNYGRGGAGRKDVLTADTVWQHFAVVSDSTLLYMYLDGEQVLWTGFDPPPPTTTPVSVGHWLGANGATAYFFDGLIDEVRIWNVAVPQFLLESRRFQRLTGNEPGLIAYWRMDEGEGDATFDMTGRGRTLQLGNQPGADGAEPLWVTPGVSAEWP